MEQDLRQRHHHPRRTRLRHDAQRVRERRIRVRRGALPERRRRRLRLRRPHREIPSLPEEGRARIHGRGVHSLEPAFRAQRDERFGYQFRCDQRVGSC